MARRSRLAWDASCFTAWADRSSTEDPACLAALDVKMRGLALGLERIVASRAVEIEVRLGSAEEARRFHQQLRACPSFEGFGESQAIRRLAASLADRLQESGRRGRYADLIHVATAISARATELWTLDKKMVRWHTEGVLPEIVICRTYLVQGVMELE